MRMHPIALAVASLSLVAPAAAQAHRLGARLTFTHPEPRAKVTQLAVGMGDVYDIGCQNLPLSGSRVVRIVVSYYDPPDRWTDCAQSASTAGYRILLGVQWDNAWPTTETITRFREILMEYAQFNVWAVAAGNEEDLATSGGNPLSGVAYAQTWRAVEPVMAALMPRAIRVALEVSPWGMRFARDAVTAGLPGAQVISAHVYPRTGTLSPDAFGAVARSAGVQAWATEGMCGPSAWTWLGCRSPQTLQTAGFALGLVWYTTEPVQRPVFPTSPTMPLTGTEQAP